MTHKTLPHAAIIFCIASLVASTWAAAIGLTPVQAAGIDVTIVNDEFNSTSGCSLREAIYAANIASYFGGCPAQHGTNVINLPAGTYTISLEGANEDEDRWGDLDILSNVVIRGAGSGSTIVKVTMLHKDRVFDINPLGSKAINVTLQGLTIQGGGVDSIDGGAGLRNTLANVQLMDVVFQNNAATAAPNSVGGAVSNLNSSSLVLDNTVFTGNTVIGYGGAIYNEGTLSIANSQFSGQNQATKFGSVLYSRGPTTIDHTSIVSNTSTNLNDVVLNVSSSLELKYSTIADNSGVGLYLNTSADDLVNISASTIARNTGVGIDLYRGKVSIANSTIAGNSSSSLVGGMRMVNPASASLLNSTIAGNAGPGIDSSGSITVSFTTIADNSGPGLLLRPGTGSSFGVQGTILARHPNGINCVAQQGTDFVSQGYNLLDNLDTTNPEYCPFDVSGQNAKDKVGSPMLAEQLAWNGGPTETYAINSSNSDAVDAVPVGDPSCPQVDQRLYSRPVQGKVGGQAACDIGAFEFAGRFEGAFLPFIRR